VYSRSIPDAVNRTTPRDRQEHFDVWGITVSPGSFLVITTVAINFLGDGLSDALGVRSK
jgi:ABC-type dipeptide/oligopeptide/nickel transport system permease subunit